MTKFRSRLLFGLITLIIVVLIGLGLLLGQLFKSFYFNTFNDRMEKEAHLVSSFVKDEGVTSNNIEKLNAFSTNLQMDITIVNKDGNIIYDSAKLDDSNDQHQEVIKQIVKKKRNNIDDFQVNKDKYEMYYYGVPMVVNDSVNGYVVLSSSIGSLKKVYQQIWGLLIGSFGLALIVIIMLGVRITARYTKPIESATDVAIELAKGNYQARTYEDHLDETGMLSQSINILARSLQKMSKAQEIQQDRLKTVIENMGSGLILIDSKGYINLVNRAYVEIFDVEPVDYMFQLFYKAFKHEEIITVVKDVFMTETTVRKQIVLPLKIERKHFEIYGAPIISSTNEEWKGVVLVFHDITELKKLEQVRKDFVANVSHELKTPITSIKGFTETLLDGAMKDEATLQQFLSIILNESDRLQALIQDLLDLSKTEQQGFRLDVSKVNIKEMLEEIIFMLTGKAADKNIELSLDTLHSELELNGDAARLKQVFINLLTNSIAYTPQNGKVNVKITANKQQVSIAVADTGIGIAEKELPRIFERFYRVDKARSRNSGGTGLGLAIVKHIVEAHHGQLFVESVLGKGTTFTVILKRS